MDALLKAPRYLVPVSFVIWGVLAPAWSQLAPLVPIDDPLAVDTLQPLAISRQSPECSGRYVYLWSLPDDTEVMQFHGDFAMVVGERRLSSREAVIWMQRMTWKETAYYHFQVFLSGNALVRESAGTAMSGPVLFVTLNTYGAPTVSNDVHTRSSSLESSLYQDALKVREQLLATIDDGGSEAVRVINPLDALRPQPQVKPRPLVRHQAKEETIDEASRTITAIGDVYVSQGLTDSADFLEIKADAAVLFLAERSRRDTDDEALPPPKPGISTSTTSTPFPTEKTGDESAGPRDTMALGEGLSAAVAGAYLKGDVVLTRGERMIRASEIYYDFENDRAIILDAVMRAMVPDRQLPIYVRAAQVRQLSRTDYAARQARISTSEFHTPHIHLGAERVLLNDVTPRDSSGRIIGLQAGQFQMHDVTMNLEGVPLAYWPYTTGNFQESESAIRSLRFGYSDDFGATFQGKWYLFNLLGVEKPQGINAILRTDYFSKRGPGVGIDSDYQFENSYGEFLGYYINDHGEDNLGPYRGGEPPTENRGRITWRHRQFLPEGFELTTEFSYISDANFLEEYFRPEFERGKEQETLVYLKKQQDNWALTALGQWRLLDFLTQTEHLPDLGFHWIGEPIGDFASYFNESHVGFARYRPDDRRLFDRAGRVLDNTARSDVVFKTETRNELDFPIKLGSANVVPFVTGRAGYWDDSPFASSLNRMFGTAGVKAGSQFWRLFQDASSSLLDINGIRHIIKPEATAWASTSSQDSVDLYPFDPGIEDVDDFYGTSLAMRQRWQTKRGGPGHWRVVDLITFDVELNLFGNAPTQLGNIGRFYESRPENSIARSHVKTDFAYHISDTTALLSESNFDLNDGNLDLFSVSYAVERTPRFSYFLGYRFIGDTDSNLVGAGANYQINTKHTIAVRTYFDLDRGETEEFDITIIRKFPRWYAGLTFGVNNIEEDFNVSLSVWPEGAPQAAIGSRRYTGLGTSTGIKPPTHTPREDAR